MKFLRFEQKKEWVRPIAIYQGYCKIHKKTYEDYKHGWKQEIECPECLAERLK